MELGFRIPIVSGIPVSLSFNADSKTQDAGFHGFPYMRQLNVPKPYYFHSALKHSTIYNEIYEVMKLFLIVLDLIGGYRKIMERKDTNLL